MKISVALVEKLHPKHIALQWAVTAGATDVSGVLFSIQRSGSPEGEWTEVAADLDAVVYIDTLEDSEDDTYEASLHSVTRELWYKVIAHLPSGLTYESSPTDCFGTVKDRVRVEQAIGITQDQDSLLPLPATPFQKSPNLGRRLQLVQNSVARRSLIALHKFSGVELAVLKRRHFGLRCTRCLDPITKHVLVSNCLDCYGTGWAGGYYPAFKTLGRIIEAAGQTAIESSGVTEINRGTLSLATFPYLGFEDVVVELDTNRRWEIEVNDVAMLRRHRVLQTCTCTELASTSIKYKVPTNTAF